MRRPVRVVVSGARGWPLLDPAAIAGLCPSRGPVPRMGLRSASMYDVSWCTVGGLVAASLNNGGVVIWDLQHLSHRASDVKVLSGSRSGGVGTMVGEHARGVNRVGWDPHHPHMIMSGSQVSCRGRESWLRGCLRHGCFAHLVVAGRVHPGGGPEAANRGDGNLAPCSGATGCWGKQAAEAESVLFSPPTFCLVPWSLSFVPWRVVRG